MSKNKEISSSKKDDIDSYLSSYLNMKSPLIGQLEFDASVLPPPVDPKFVDYEINDEIVKYKLTSLEFSERLSNFTDFNCGISDAMLQGTSFTGCGVENEDLMSYLESNVLDSPYDEVNSENSIYENVKKEIGDLVKYFESVKMGNLVNKSKESLPNYMQSLMSSNDPEAVSPQKSRGLQTSDDSLTSVTQVTTPGSQKDWESMSIEERIDVYISELEKTFVNPEELVHPTNRYLKRAKVYNIVPNSKLWNNKYIQVGIDGVSVKSDPNSKLEVDGVIRLAKETQTQRYFEYYKQYDTDDSSPVAPSKAEESKSAGDYNAKRVKKEEPEDNEEEGIDDLFEEEDDDAKDQDLTRDDDQQKGGLESPSPEQEQDGNLFKFIRQYTSQKVSKSSGTENYFLLTLPKEKEKKGKVKEEEDSDDESENLMELVPIRGQKLVFSKAGVTKRPDIRIAYVTP
ncbi:conserved hypothetical protein [Theileria orientalis strain Shintoku]|uniref:Uncharacterized protein n=1 Tax=Theileria orientalis strain Shintoku TaxID=869250 RepID=J4D8Q6_THEOR|nr:conserved hypothetical protein [Theileria orientalis strain Shintoku]BAM40930.1 conserved hypothetical protein [Theileria orientalis strain Shintoku]|eukprot:XP_009691231.1 conserved hypothetical protein [Theileria orientalis strain Shintoku]